jgi:two-component system phosphate regulon sensor histidine kinase PhoR
MIPALLTHPTPAEWDEKKRELERRKIEAQFLANVSHDLRTPVASIRGYAETLLRGGIDDAENRREFVEIIDRNAQRLGDLMESLLALATIDAAKVRAASTNVALKEFVDDVIEDLAPSAEKAGLTLSCEMDPALAVHAHQQHLWQILQNLLSNSLKYVPKGGRVSVRARERDGFVEVTVADDGPGIPKDQLSTIFDRFHAPRRGKPNGKGAGLGLTIVRTLVEAHGGRTWAEFAVGGAVLRFTLPAAGKPAAAA